MFISYLSSIINWEFVENSNQNTMYTLDQYIIKISKSKKKKIQLDIKMDTQRKSIVNETFDNYEELREYIEKLSICNECNIGVIFNGASKCNQCALEDKYNMNCPLFNDNCMVCLEPLKTKNVSHVYCHRNTCQYFLHRGCFLKCNTQKISTEIIDDFEDETFDESEISQSFQVFKCLICKHYNIVQNIKNRFSL